MAAPTDALADWRAEDLRVLAKVDTLTTRTAGVLATPGLAAPHRELAEIVAGLLGLIRDQIVPDGHPEQDVT